MKVGRFRNLDRGVGGIDVDRSDVKSTVRCRLQQVESTDAIDVLCGDERRAAQGKIESCPGTPLSWFEQNFLSLNFNHDGIRRAVTVHLKINGDGKRPFEQTILWTDQFAVGRIPDDLSFARLPPASSSGR